MVLSSVQMPVAEILSLNICGLISQMLKVILFFLLHYYVILSTAWFLA